MILFKTLRGGFYLKKIFFILILVTLMFSSLCSAKIVEEKDDFTGNTLSYSIFQSDKQGLFGINISPITYNFSAFKTKEKGTMYFIKASCTDSSRIAFQKEGLIKIGDNIYKLPLIQDDVKENWVGNFKTYNAVAFYAIPSDVIKQIKNITDYSSSPIMTRFNCKGLYSSNGDDYIDDCKVNLDTFQEWKEIISKYGIPGGNSQSTYRTSINQSIPTPNQLGDATLNGLLATAVGFNTTDIDMAKEALHRGANPNYTGNGYGYTTPFIQVISQKNLPAIKMFIAYGADVNMKIFQNNGDDTPLYDGIRTSSLKIVKTLVEAGADINAPLSQDLSLGWTAMITFSRMDMNNQENVNILNYLISKGANLYVTNKNGATLLMASASSGNFPLTKMYLDLGLDPNKRDNNGKRALDYAISNGDKSIINLLLPLTK